jgi:hypothetical protein
MIYFVPDMFRPTRAIIRDNIYIKVKVEAHGGEEV